MIFMIFLGADMLNSALALTQAPNQLAATVGALGWPPLAIVAAILVFYVLLGCVMDELSMILLTIPIFFPLIMALDLGLKPDETGDLVRHPGADGGRDRADRAARWD
jgi:C4-dicarboxylate transporter DctM subunit